MTSGSWGRDLICTITYYGAKIKIGRVFLLNKEDPLSIVQSDSFDEVWEDDAQIWTIVVVLSGGKPEFHHGQNSSEG